MKVPNGICDFHVARFRLQSALSRKLSANAFIQYNSDLRHLSTNIRIRYNPSEGVDLYIVYHEGFNTDLEWKTPRLPLTSGRALFVKYIYTFVL